MASAEGDEQIKQFLKKKDFYEILGVSKTASDDDLKKQYRKLALKFHPDKNKHEGAQDVFKKISEAYDCLSNPDKRAVYDKYGNEPPEQHQQHYRQHYRQDDVFAEDIFNIFFGGGFPQNGQNGTYYRTYQFGGNQGRRQYQQQQNGNNQQHHRQGFTIWQLIPLFLIMFSSSIFSMFEREQIYSFQYNSNYPVRRATNVLQVEYFVKNNFVKEQMQNNKEQIRQIELEIEQVYVNDLRKQCKRAKETVESYLYQAKWSFRNKAQYERAASQVSMTSCQQLEDYQSKMPNFQKIYG